MQDSPWENRQCTGKGIIMAAADIGIDLGTSSILVYTKSNGKKGVSQAKDQHLRAKRRDRSGT